METATGGMLARLNELEGELTNLLDALRRSGERLNEGLAELQRQVGEVGGEAAPRAVAPPADTPAISDTTASRRRMRDGDEAGARLIALNMALSGSLARGDRGLPRRALRPRRPRGAPR